MMVKRIILAAIAIMLIAAVTAQAAVFQQGSLVVAGDTENTYVCDAEKAEGQQTAKAFYRPPDGNFCVYGDRLYFDADQQLIEYALDSGNNRRLAQLGYGRNGRTVFAGILDDRLYFTTVKGSSDDKRMLSCLDLATGTVSEVRSGVYEACIWDGKLFVVMSVVFKDAPDETHTYFGAVTEDFSSLTPYSKHAVCPKDPAGHIMWASPDALYFQQYAIDEATGENTGIALCKLWKNPQDGSIHETTYGTAAIDDAHFEYLGTDGEWMPIRLRHPEDESKNEVVLQHLSDDSIITLRFPGNTGNQQDADVVVSDSDIFYMSDDCRLWRLDMAKQEFHLVGSFPQDTSIQGITATDVYYICGGSLYCSPLAELMTAMPEAAEAQDAAPLIEAVEEGLRKTVESCAPTPYILPEILKHDPQIEPWLREAAGKNLQAVVSLDSGVELSAGLEGRDVRLHIRAGDESVDRQLALPEGIADMGSIWQLSELLKGSRVDVEDGVCEAGTVRTESGTETITVPCRIYHTVVSWQSVQYAMSALYGSLERLSTGTFQLPDISGQIASLEELADDGISIDFYITDEGCIRIEAAVEKTPRVIGACGGTPEFRHISASRYTAGARWSLVLQRNQSMLLNMFDKNDIKADIRVIMKTEISSGSYPDQNNAYFSLEQFKDQTVYRERISIPLPGLRSFGGVGNTSGSLSLGFDPESNRLTGSLSVGDLSSTSTITVLFDAPEVSGSRLIIPFAASGMGSMFKGIPKTKGTLALEYR